MTLHNLPHYDEEKIGIREIVKYFWGWRKIILICCFIGLVAGVVYGASKFHYRTTLVLGSGKTKHNITDSPKLMETNLVRLFSQPEMTKKFADVFYEKLLASSDADPMFRNSLEYFSNKNGKNAEDLKLSKKKLAQAILYSNGKTFFNFDYEDDGRWRLALDLNDKNISYPVVYATIMAFNETVNVFNEAEVNLIQSQNMFQLEQGKKKIGILYGELNKEIALANEENERFVQEYEILKKKIRSIGISLEEVINKSNLDINRISFVDQDPSLLVEVGGFFELNDMVKFLAGVSVPKTGKKIAEECMDKLLELKRIHNELYMKRTNIVRLRDAAFKAVQQLNDRYFGVDEIRDLGIRSVQVDWDIIGPDLQSGIFTKKKPDIFLTSLIGVIGGLFVSLIWIFIREIII